MQKEFGKVRIKTEKAATRCEVCHQSDMFDPETENCIRCSQVEKTLATKPTVIRSLWSPRFALIEREDQAQNSQGNLNKIFVLLICIPTMIFCKYYDTFIGTLLSVAIISLIYLLKSYNIKRILRSYTNNALSNNNHSNQQITTLFDKYPEEKIGREINFPDNDPVITTIFGENNKKR
jgi:hypothetical protein